MINGQAFTVGNMVKATEFVQNMGYELSCKTTVDCGAWFKDEESSVGIMWFAMVWMMRLIEGSKEYKKIINILEIWTSQWIKQVLTHLALSNW